MIAKTYKKRYKLQLKISKSLVIFTRATYTVKLPPPKQWTTKDIFWFCTCKKQSEKVYEQQLYLSWNFSFWQTKKKGKTAKKTIRKNDTRNHTLSPLSDFVSIMVRTVSYKMALPTFLLVSVFVATCKEEKKNRKINTSKITQFLGIGIHRKNVPINFVLL